VGCVSRKREREKEMLKRRLGERVHGKNAMNQRRLEIYPRPERRFPRATNSWIYYNNHFEVLINSKQIFRKQKSHEIEIWGDCNKKYNHS
jgi:hypothetical protein